MSIRNEDIRALGRLWRELAEFPASDRSGSLQHVLRSLNELIGAERAWWLVALKQGRPPPGPEQAWRAWKAVYSRHLAQSDDDEVVRDHMLQRYAAGDADLYHRRRLDLPGPCHVARPSDLLTRREWRGGWFYQEIRKPRGIDDVLVGTYFYDPDTTIHVGLDRGARNRSFNERSREILALFLGGAHPWVREQLLGGGWIETTGRLTPRERDVLSLLLTDLSEKEISTQLELTPASTHQYVTTILRRFGVSGRAGLTALWLRHRR